MSFLGKSGLLLLACAALQCPSAHAQPEPANRHRAVLILVLDQPIRPFAREILEGIQEAHKDAINLSVFVEFLGPTALETEALAAQRRKLWANRYAGSPIEAIVAIGDRMIADAEVLRHDLFPAAKLFFLFAGPRDAVSGIAQGEGLHVNSSPLDSVKVALSLMPTRSKLVVVSGTTALDQALRESVTNALDQLPRKVDVEVWTGFPLIELRDKAARLRDDSIIVLTSNMADRSGRMTTNVEQARELSMASKAPVVEGTDLSMGVGSIGGDVASYRTTGLEIGRRIRRTLDTGEAPQGVVVDPAPRRKVLDWRQLKRFGIDQRRVPPEFEILFRQPTLWEQYRGVIVAVFAGLILQTLLISFLLAERKRRAEAQARMQRQLGFEAMVSKASADFSVVTHDDLPARFLDISSGLAECLGVERVSVWIHASAEQGYILAHRWPSSAPGVNADDIEQRFPYLHKELLAGKVVTAVGLGELPPDADQDVTELRALGFLSLATVPLRLGGVPIGALVLGTNTHTTNWDNETISTLQVLADVLAQGISRSMSDERARRSEEQNRAMLASLPGFVSMIDGTGLILRQNNRLDLVPAHLPKALAHAAVGQNLLALLREYGDSAVATALEEVVDGRRTSLVMEYRYDTDDGPRWIEIRAESLAGEQRGAVVSQTDITDRKKSENESAQNRQTVWHLNRVAALGELTASLAHEINQPLAAILNSAEAAAVLLQRPSPDIAEALEAVQDIIEDDKRAGAVIRRMRSMLKRDHERPQAVDLNATVTETLRLVTNEARLRHVSLSFEADSSLQLIVADPTQLQQVILNLVTNGIEAVEMMPGHRQVKISTSRQTTDGLPLLEVRDNGPGIPADQLATIFEPFYTSKREGLGLGLPICRSIIDSFGGKVAVDCPPERGAVFRVVLRWFAGTSRETQQTAKVGA